MGKRIQGITIQIDGETVKLNDALRKTETQLNATQRSLKDVNKLLKLDPKNTELLKQKQTYLNDAIGLTKDKLKQEQDALKQLQDDPTPENAEQQRALARQIEETKQSLEKLTDEYKEFGSVGAQKLKQAGQDMQNAGKKVQELGNGLTTHVTAPILAVGAASAAAWKEVDDGMDIVIDKTGATGEALEEMQDIAKEIPQTINVSFEDAGTAVGEVNTRFGVTGKRLEEVSKLFLQFAEINGEDVNSSIDEGQKTMEAWNISVDQAEAFLGTLNATGQATGISMSSLMQQMQANKKELSEMGFTAADAATFLGQCEMSGADVSTVMAGMKKAMQNATKEGKSLSDSLQEFDGVMNSNASDTEKLQTAYDLFGKKAGAAIYDAASTGSLAMGDLGKSLEDNLGSVESTFDATQDPADKLATTLNTLKVVGSDLIEVAGTIGLPLLEQLGQKARELKGAWDGLSPSQQQMIIKLAGIAAVAGPVISVIGSLIIGAGSLVTAFGSISGFVTATLIPALTTAGPAIAAVAAPILPVIAVVGGLTAAGVLLYKNWDKVSATGKKLGASVKKMGQDVKNGAVKAWDDLKKKTSDTWDSVKKKVSESMDKAGKDTQSGIDKIKGFFKFKPTWPTVPKMKLPSGDVKSGIEKIKGFFKFDIKLPDVGAPKWPDLSQKLADIKGKLKFDWKLPAIGKPSWPDLSEKLSSVKGKLKFDWKLPSIGAPSWPNITEKLSKIKEKLKFKWKLPDIELPKMPSISLNWSSRTFFGKEISYPTGFSVKWNKDAMLSGIIMKRPTIFGMDRFGRALGGGEAGSETIVRTGSLMSMVYNAAANGMRSQTAELAATYNYWGRQFMKIMSEYFPQFVDSGGEPLDMGRFANAIMPEINRRMGREVMHKERGI